MSTLNTSELVHLTAEHGVSTITLDSPRNRNALSAQLRTELRQLLEAALDDESTRVIVLTHTGPVFCAGADLKEARSADTTQSGGELVALLETLMTADKPVVARLAGPARAGGIGLVAACDFAIAADDRHLRVHRGPDRGDPLDHLGTAAAASTRHRHCTDCS